MKPTYKNETKGYGGCVLQLAILLLAAVIVVPIWKCANVLMALMLVSAMCMAQDSIKVKITRIVKKDSVTHIWMKTESGSKLYTECKCMVSHKEKETVWIKKPEL